MESWVGRHSSDHGICGDHNTKHDHVTGFDLLELMKGKGPLNQKVRRCLETRIRTLRHHRRLQKAMLGKEYRTWSRPLGLT